jgi:hypothetical protein
VPFSLYAAAGCAANVASGSETAQVDASVSAAPDAALAPGSTLGPDSAATSAPSNAGSADAGLAADARSELPSYGDATTAHDGGALDDARRTEIPGDAAAADGSASPGCARATFALCDDFEKGALDTGLWKLTQKQGTVTLDTTRGARGSKSSVHVHVNPGSDTTVGMVEAQTFPALKAHLFARAFLYIPAAMSSSLFSGDRHSRLIYAQGASPYGEYALGIWNGGIIQNHYSSSDDSQDSKLLPPFDQWFCLEYELDSAAGNVKAYLNDAELMDLRHSGWPASNIDTLMFGVDRYGNFPVAEDIWFDDLVVDSARIGCTR